MKAAFDLEDKNLRNSLKLTFPTTLKVKHFAIHIYTKHILAHDQHHITERFEKISDGLYIRDEVYINLLLPVTGTTGTR